MGEWLRRSAYISMVALFPFLSQVSLERNIIKAHCAIRKNEKENDSRDDAASLQEKGYKFCMIGEEEVVGSECYAN